MRHRKLRFEELESREAPAKISPSSLINMKSAPVISVQSPMESDEGANTNDECTEPVDSSGNPLPEEETKPIVKDPKPGPKPSSDRG